MGSRKVFYVFFYVFLRPSLKNDRMASNFRKTNKNSGSAIVFFSLCKVIRNTDSDDENGDADGVETLVQGAWCSRSGTLHWR